MLSMARYGTRDVKRAKEFYDAVTAPLGATRVLDRQGVVGYKGPEGGMFLIGTPLKGEANVGNGTQMGFVAPSRVAVDTVYAKALELGGSCEGPPGVRANGMYAAYFRDPDGNKLFIFRAGD